MAKHTDVYELCSLDEYDTEQAKIRSSLGWLIAKAHPRGVPEKLQDLFLTDQDGVWYVRPAVIDSLVSCELYSAACNTLFGTPERRFSDFDSVLGYLRDCGILLQYGEDGELSSELLRGNASGAQEAAFDVYAHITLCDCLMQAYANDLVKLDFILETTNKYASAGRPLPTAASFDEALVLWLNGVCSQCDLELEKRAQLDSSFQYEVPQLANVNDDLADGRCLCLALFFYAPVGFVRLDDLALQRTPSLADSIHNLASFLRIYEAILQQLTAVSGSKKDDESKSSDSAFTDVVKHLTSAQAQLLRTFRCYLTVEDLLYAVRTVELNAIVFLLELFYVSECVLNGSVPQIDPTAAAVAASAFVPALETVVEVEADLEAEINASPSEAEAEEAELHAKGNQSAEDDGKDDSLECGQFALGSNNRPMYKTYTKEYAKRAEANLAAKRPESTHQSPPSVDSATCEQSSSESNAHADASTRNKEQNGGQNADHTQNNSSSSAAQSQADASSRVTFGMLKRKPTPLVSFHSGNTASASNSATASPVRFISTPPTVSSTSVVSVASVTPVTPATPTVSLKEQFLKSKLARREQPPADPKSASSKRDGPTQTTTWANLKRRSQPDLDSVNVGRTDGRSAFSLASGNDRMTQSVVIALSQPTPIGATPYASDLSLGSARLSPAHSGAQSPSPASPSPDLTALHLRFEQKKRAIETERARMLDDLTRQRQAVSNQAFAHVLNLRRTRVNDSPITVSSSQSQSSPATQRSRTASLVNVTSQSNDEQLRFLEKVDGDLNQFQAEIERLQQRHPPSHAPATATLNDPAQQRATWQQTPPPVRNEVTEPESARSTASGDRSTSKFFLTDAAPAGADRPPPSPSSLPDPQNNSNNVHVLVQRSQANVHIPANNLQRDGPLTDASLPPSSPRLLLDPVPPKSTAQPLLVSVSLDSDRYVPSWPSANGDSELREQPSAPGTGRSDPASPGLKASPASESLRLMEAALEANDRNHLSDNAEANSLSASGYSLEASRGSSNAVGFVIADESFNPAELEDRRRRRLLEAAARRAEEAAARQREREAEAAARELERTQRADDNERRKQAEKARREAIFKGYVERKQSESTGPPYTVSNYSAHTAPSSMRTARAPAAKVPPVNGGTVRRASSVRRKTERDERTKSAFVLVDGDDLDNDAQAAVAMSSSVERSALSTPHSEGVTARVNRAVNANANANSAFSRASSATRSFRVPQRNLDSLHSGVSQTVLANADVNVNVANPDADPQTKLFVKPKSKSNRSVIMNAVAYACLAGSVNEAQKRTVLEEIERCNASHFVILFRDSGSSQFKAVYVFDEERDCLNRLVGVGPRQLTSVMVEKFFKFNSGAKSFSEVTSTRHLSTVIDAVTLFERYWQVLKKSTQLASSNAIVSSCTPAAADPRPQAVRAPHSDRVVVPSVSSPSQQSSSRSATRRGISPAPPVFAAPRTLHK